MPKNNKGTGGATQDIDAAKKPKQPKPVAQVTLTLREDGSIAGDFWVWEIDDLERRKKWTVSGDDFFKFVHRVQPGNVRVLASCFNVQIVTAGLPEDQQGPWLTRKGGKMSVLTGEEVKKLMPQIKSPVGSGQGDKLAESSDKAAERSAGISGPQAV